MRKRPLTRARERINALQIENRRLRREVRQLKDKVRAAYILGSEDARAYLEGGEGERPDVETVGEEGS